MEITEVKVFPVSEDKLKAFVSVVLDCCFMVNDIKVIRGKDGLFISMPSRKKKNGEFKDVAHPLNNETRRMIEERVLDEYERVLRGRGEAPEVGRRRLRIDDEEEAATPSGMPAAPVPEPAPGVPPAAPPPVADGGDELPRPATASGPVSASVPGPARESERSPEAPPAAVQGGDGRRDAESPEGKSLEEIQEMHLRDSFWSVS